MAVDDFLSKYHLDHLPRAFDAVQKDKWLDEETWFEFFVSPPTHCYTGDRVVTGVGLRGPVPPRTVPPPVTTTSSNVRQR